MLSADLFRDRRSQLAKVVLLMCGVYFALAFAGQAWKAKGLAESLSVEEARLQEQTLTTDELRARLELLSGKGYDTYVERTAREKLSMARPGERAVFVVPDENAPTRAPSIPLPLEPAQPVIATPKEPIWRQWVSVFFP